ncbi:GNAT family N-acetyltransferase [Laspinema olomoucense]|uniref:GNAT family N-acetyltransferase n=1 Tax=Laspinema olomoucense D3b TaxID=2953688 RepID=A0ABT2N883_9CYAN|nr:MULTISPECIES: GNAT family N-acetyltransferase [unclassified Laspinema]MCT7977466.1 GNAT family N-acetyltransferase [Laspinema sp. D3b]MCT7986879.1 GNAT family N-acetyltransferase [Laspinema sp. D3a]
MTIFLETERLILRYFNKTDAHHLLELDSDPAVMRYINGGIPSNLADVEALLDRILDYYEKYENFGFWATHEKVSGEFIGWFHFYPVTTNPFGIPENLFREGETSLGYRFRQSSWGKGYGTEGARSLRNKGFNEWEVERIIAWALPANQASIRVMEKVGLKFEGSYQLKLEHLPALKHPEERLLFKYGCDNTKLLSRE